MFTVLKLLVYVFLKSDNASDIWWLFHCLTSIPFVHWYAVLRYVQCMSIVRESDVFADVAVMQRECLILFFHQSADFIMVLI